MKNNSLLILLSAISTALLIIFACANAYLWFENHQLKRQVRLLTTGSADEPLSAAAGREECINKLRILDSAIQQWALEEKKSPTDPVSASALARYIPGGQIRCPSGGTYAIGTAADLPTCSIKGHELPK